MRGVGKVGEAISCMVDRWVRHQNSAHALPSSSSSSCLLAILHGRPHSHSHSHSHSRMATLAFEEIEIPAKQPAFRTAIILHGLMGSSRNWRSFAKNLARAATDHGDSNAPGWKMVLVDLRNHGLSATLEGFGSPHDIPSAARDLADLIKVYSHLQPDVIIGHSLGGKVALDFVLNSAEKSYGHRVSLPKQAWILDSVPGNVHEDDPDGEVERVLKTIQTLPLPIPSRRWLVEHMINLGFSKGLSDWLGTNLKRVNTSSEESVWLFNVNGIYDMFMSYRKLSYWSILEDPPKATEIGIIRASKSDRWSPDVIARLEQIVSKSKKDSSVSGLVSYDILPNSGHWVHVDNPGGLIEILAPALSQLSS